MGKFFPTVHVLKDKINLLMECKLLNLQKFALGLWHNTQVGKLERWKRRIVSWR
jgi:hypothetical protein